MKRGLDWYPREQRAILDSIRAARMTARQAAIYNVIIDLIYDGAGETPDDPRHIASYLSDVGQAAARATIQQLVDMGKINRVGEMLHQKRAENVAKTRQNLRETRAETGRLGGISSGKTRRGLNENNDLGEASASSKTEAEKEKIREEEKEEPIGSSKKSGRKPEVPIPENWVPSDRNIADAETRQFSAKEIEDEADRFRNHHIARDTRFRDWDAAWRTWLGNSRKFSNIGLAFKATSYRHGQGGSIASIAARRRVSGQV